MKGKEGIPDEDIEEMLEGLDYQILHYINTMCQPIFPAAFNPC